MRLQKKDECKFIKKKRERLKGVYITDKKEGKFGKKINLDVSGHRTLFWKKVSEVKGRKEKSAVE